MIALILAIAAAWLLIGFTGFVFTVLLAAFGRWLDERDMRRALRWWESLTADEQARRLERFGHRSEANILRVPGTLTGSCPR